jgi:hypothetical protein
VSNEEGGTDVVTAGDRVVTQPADRALGYGKRAATHGARVAQAPSKKPPTKAKPPHVRAAERERDRLAPFLPNSALKKKVRMYDLAKFSVPEIADFGTSGGIAAWTNSSSEIFVIAGLELPANYPALRAAMYHEFLHVDQFSAKGQGKPPSTYLTMIKYEVDAYQNSANWLRNPTDGRQPDEVLAKEMDAGLDFFTKWLTTTSPRTPGESRAFIAARAPVKCREPPVQLRHQASAA